MIPVPANEIVRASQNTANAGFLRSLINILRDGRLELSRYKDRLRNNPSGQK